MGPTSIELAVFPLGMSFFPSTSVPLHIFEPRYLQMVQDSFDHGRAIALSYDDPTDRSAQSLRLIAGFGSPMLIEKRKDGTLLILLRGQGKARLGRILRREPYIVCDARTIADAEEPSESNRFRLNRYRRMLDRWFDSNVKEARHRAMLSSGLDTPARLVEFIATHVVADPEARQMLLEKDDINDRLALMQHLPLDGEESSSTAGATPTQLGSS